MTRRSLKSLPREDLEDLVHYYEDLLGVSEDHERLAVLRRVFRLPPAAAWLLSRLVAADGRLLRRDALIDNLPASDAAHDRGDKLIDVHLVKIRKALGADAIETERGVGWRLSPLGKLRTRRALGQPEAA